MWPPPRRRRQPVPPGCRRSDLAHRSRDRTGTDDLRGAGLRPPAELGRCPGGSRLPQRRHPVALPGAGAACEGLLGVGPDFGQGLTQPPPPALVKGTPQNPALLGTAVAVAGSQVIAPCAAAAAEL